MACAAGPGRLPASGYVPMAAVGLAEEARHIICSVMTLVFGHLAHVSLHSKTASPRPGWPRRHDASGERPTLKDGNSRCRYFRIGSDTAEALAEAAY